VELVATGCFADCVTSYDGRIRLRALWNVVLALEPALGSAVEKVALNRRLQMNQRMLYTLKPFDPTKRVPLAGLLNQASCNSVAVLERTKSRWVVEGCEVVDSGANTGRRAFWIEMLSESDPKKLDDIAAHPSGRGLVLAGSDLGGIFLRLRRRTTSVSIFIHPVWVNRGASCRLVAFAFEGNTSRDINGARQKQLSSMAHFAVA